MNQRRGFLLKEHASMLELVFRTCDPLIVIGSALLIFEIYLGFAEVPTNYWYAMITTSLMVAVIFPGFKVYRAARGGSMWFEVQGLFTAWAVVAGLLLVLFFGTKTGATFSRVWMTGWAITSLVGLISFRISLRLLLRVVRSRGYNLRHIVIAGAGPLGVEVAQRLKRSQWAGLNLLAYFDDDAVLQGKQIAGVSVEGSLDDVRAYVEDQSVDQVWIALPLRAEERVAQLLDSLSDTTVEVRYLPDIFGFQLFNHSLTEVAGLPVINLTESPLNGFSHVQKVVFDYIVSTIILICISPIMLAIALGIKLSSPGPIFYRQKRVTWNNATFEIIKFRTMPVDSEKQTGAVWAKEGEDRAFAFGKFLRRFSLDELPQFINVLRGEMSIVGPRPERPEFISQFKREIPGYMQKHLVKAGITGWAQVNDLRGSTDLTQRIEHDLYYIDNWSLWFDVRIVALTAFKMFFSKHAY
jgi:putative colanic acid biosysnthesis UDP-glucose lipid carrier transferase